MYPRLSNSTLSQLAAALLLVTCSLLPEDARAQEVDPDYTLTAQNATVLLGQTSEIVVTLDSAGDPIQGWSFGLCHDDTVLDFVGSEYGHTLNTVKNGNPADFVDISVQDGGWTTGVIVCLTACAALLPGSGHELYVATYQDATGNEGSTDVCFCDHLGSPVVESFVIIAGQSVVPVKECATVDIIDQAPFIFAFEEPTGFYSPYDGVGQVASGLSVVQFDPGSGVMPIEAFSMSIQHDPSRLVATSLELTDIVTSLNGGDGPDFVGPQLIPGGATIGTVFSFLDEAAIDVSEVTEVARITYETVTGAWIGNELGGTTWLTFVDGLGSPAVSNTVVLDGTTYTAEPGVGVVELEAILVPPFTRGDCNNDLNGNMADGIWLLNYLYGGGPASACLAACDTDGNSSLDLADAILLLQHFLVSGPPPAAPYPSCGVDETADCEEYPSCL
jgi:hypothetical protein